MNESTKRMLLLAAGGVFALTIVKLWLVGIGFELFQSRFDAVFLRRIPQTTISSDALNAALHNTHGENSKENVLNFLERFAGIEIDENVISYRLHPENLEFIRQQLQKHGYPPVLGNCEFVVLRRRSLHEFLTHFAGIDRNPDCECEGDDFHVVFYGDVDQFNFIVHSLVEHAYDVEEFYLIAQASFVEDK